MAVKLCFCVEMLSLLVMITAGTVAFNVITPFKIPGLNSLLKTVLAGMIRLLVLLLLSTHSAQYIMGPRCKATLPISLVIFSLATTLLTSIGKFTSTTSFFFHGLLMIA